MMFSIRNLAASRVNLVMNDFAAGLPSPLSFLGLGDTLVRSLGLEPWSARVLPILHQVSVSTGRTKPEMEANGVVFSPIEIMEDLIGSVVVSLLIDIPGLDDDLALKEALVGRRIAGGTISNERFLVDAVTADGSAFSKMQRGYAIIAAKSEERRILSTGSKESLASVAATLFPSTRPPGFGWPIPAAVGYRLLEDPETVPARSRSRSRTVPHVFAEPVLGIAELVSVRNEALNKADAAELAALLWGWDARDTYILGHSAYHPSPAAASRISNGQSSQ